VILELLEHCFTPCSWLARSMGFLTSSIQVRARYQRCRAAWHPHLERTRTAILTAAGLATGRRKALLFGAGLLHDIPLRELSDSFEEVVLADIVHALPSRVAAMRFSNVRLLTLDVTGVMWELPRLRDSPNARLPASMPQAFLKDERLDFSVSVNLLSQLGWIPGRVLGGTRPEAELAKFQKGLVLAHLEYLRKLPGHSALVTDVRWSARPHPQTGDAEGREWEVLQGLALPEPDCAWDWQIAPAPERERGVDYAARVHAYSDWKQSADLFCGGGRWGGGSGEPAAKN
jgi:hypothetical protein